MGRQQRPETDANSLQWVGRAWPAARAGSPKPRGRATPRPGSRGPRRENGGAHAPGGRALHSHGWRAAATSSPGRGAHTTCCLSREEHPQPRRPFFLFAAPEATQSPARLGRRSRARLRRLPRGRAAPPPVEPALLACLGRGLARRCTDLSLAGEARTASSSAAGPPPSPAPSPRAPRTGADRPGRGAGGGDRARGAQRGAPLCALGSKPISWGGFRGSPSPEPPPALFCNFQKAERRRQIDREVGEKVGLSFGELVRGHRRRDTVPVCFCRSGIWDLSSSCKMRPWGP